MKRQSIFRLTIFFTAILLLMALIGWSASTSWRRIGGLREQILEKQLERFEYVRDLQQTIFALNYVMLRFVVDQKEADKKNDWTTFSNSSDDLTWKLNHNRPKRFLQASKPFLDDMNAAYNDINTAYRSYLAAAVKIKNSNDIKDRMNGFPELVAQSDRIVALCIQLSTAQQKYIEFDQLHYLHDLDYLSFVLLGALVILLAVVLWFAVVVYRDLIAPLQVQLVESRQLAERQEKLASLGMLAAGVAHEIRNPLTAIEAWLYLQQKHMKPGTPEYSDAELIGGEINRLERIVRDFLQLARPSEPHFTVTPADQPLREAQRLMQLELEKAGIKIVLGEMVTAPIRIDPQQIKQVLLNLIQNARDSIEKNGTVTLSARLDNKRINNHDTSVVILEVADTGKGILPAAEKRLFDPFFTTKENGTGLGLPIAARIVEKHLGALQYQTQPDHGTTFGIILPRHKS